MISYRAFEMHCHTQHSDGKFTLQELLDAACAYGFAGICLTDHNTSSGIRQLPEVDSRGLLVVPGIEWTTFFGHLLVLGCSRYVDWRTVQPDTIDTALREIRRAGGVSGVAHPFELGAPLSCGSHWDFQVKDWSLVDYMEVWSGDAPHRRLKNQLALSFYDGLLSKGHRLALTAGRDWHGPDGKTRPIVSATYLGIENGPIRANSVLRAIRMGRTYVTVGPELALSVWKNGTSFQIGDTIPAGTVHVSFKTKETEGKTAWGNNGAQPQEMRVIINGANAWMSQIGQTQAEFSLDVPKGWMRMEVWGMLENEWNRLALTSPFYIET